MYTFEIPVDAIQALYHALPQEFKVRPGKESPFQLLPEPIGQHIRETAHHTHQLLLPQGEARGGGVTLALREKEGGKGARLKQCQELTGEPFCNRKPENSSGIEV